MLRNGEFKARGASLEDMFPLTQVTGLNMEVSVHNSTACGKPYFRKDQLVWSETSEVYTLQKSHRIYLHVLRQRKFKIFPNKHRIANLHFAVS